MKARDARFENCVFEQFDDRSGVFGGSTFRDTNFADCHLENTSIQLAELVMVVLLRCELRYVIFGQTTGTNLVMKESKLNDCGFVDSDYGNIGLHHCTLRGITFDAFNVERVSLRNAPSIQALTIVDCLWKHSLVADCEVVSELKYVDSRLENWTIVHSMIAFLVVRNGKISGESGISGSEVAGFNFSGTTAIGLRVARSSFHGSVILNNATFDSLVITDLHYGPSVKVQADGVKYVNGSTQFTVA